MTQSHFHDEALKGQHISEEEAAKVVALWAERQRERDRQAAEPTVEVVAEGLDIPADEVLRLLSVVRARGANAQAHQPLVSERKHEVRRALRAAAIIIVAAVLVLLVLRTTVRVARPPVPPVAVEMVQPPAENTFTDNSGTTYVRRADGSVSLRTPEGSYEYRSDGSLTVSGPEGTYRRAADGSIVVRGPDGSLIRRADGSEERRGSPPGKVTAPTPPPGVALPAMP